MGRAVMTNQPCSKCGAARAVVSHEWLRAERLRAGYTLREMARKLGFSAPYVSDVEHGRRHCTPKIRQAYEALR